MNESSITYPFSAIVGQDEMKLALCLNAVNPGIGGVLISGERGTAKTTAVRALANILSGSRVVELPLNATEDRVVGTLRIDALMKSGERVFVPGILSEADGNILYVDEVNLLEDHIVDLLLDAAATGVCRIEREGVSEVRPARFVLVGTMNPEEGTLRPQLLDRFGLSVKIGATLTRGERMELMRRQIEFEADPVAFCERYKDEDKRLEERIAVAQELYSAVEYPENLAALAAGICESIRVEGFRADITIMKTARAAAAFGGRCTVTRDDVVCAARFALPHRMKKMPFEEGGLTEAMLMSVVEGQEQSMIDDLPDKANSEQNGEGSARASDGSQNGCDQETILQEDQGTSEVNVKKVQG